MGFEESSLTLGGETRKVKNLDFVNSGTIVKTDAKGVTTVTNGEYTFLVTEDTLRYRRKPAGATASTRIKHLKSFEDLAKLQIAKAAVEEQENKNTSAQGTQEESIMAVLKFEGKTIDIPAPIKKILEANGEKSANLTLEQFDAVMKKAKGADLAALTQFEEVIDAAVNAGTDTPAPPPNAKPDQQKDAGEKKEEPKTTQQQPPANEGTGGDSDEIQTSSVFSGGAGGGGNTRPGVKKVKTEEERQAERLERKRKREEEAALMQQNSSRMEQIRAETAEVESGAESIKALKELLLIQGRLPYLATSVASDTRLRPLFTNLIKPADREYHPKLQNNPEYQKKGKDIEAKYAKALYDFSWVESSPSQPTGYYVWVPESLMNLTPSKLSQHSEREYILGALESGKTELQVKYFPKAEIIWLLNILDAEMLEYSATTGKFVETAPRIYCKSSTDPASAVPVYSLRARDAEGRTAKLSVRSFLPNATHDTIKTSSNDFDKQITTDIMFKRILTYVPEGHPADKFSQLTPEARAMFTQKPDGTILFNNFRDRETVVLYDSTKHHPKTGPVLLPKVVMNTPSTAGAVARPVFSKSKHTELGYNTNYAHLKDLVGDQINKQRKQTNKSILSEHNEEINRLEAVRSLLHGSPIKIK